MINKLAVPAFLASVFLATWISGNRGAAAEIAWPVLAIENGDANGDWDIDISDGIHLFAWLYLGGPAPAPIACGTDVPSRRNGDNNGDGEIDISDGVYLLAHLFLGGPEPVQIDCGWTAGAGGEAAVQRPITDFLDAQGTFCIDDGMGGCFLFAPPYPNFIAWFDPATNYNVSLDYAGLQNRWIEGETGGAVSFGTRLSGSVSERTLPDGRAEVHIRLHTQSGAIQALDGDDGDFNTAPLLFGNRPLEVLAGAEAALGESLLHLVINNTAPGAPLPDLIQLFISPLPGQELKQISITARGDGPLHAQFGVPEGAPGRIEVTQVGLLAIPSQSPSFDGFPAEHIEIRAVGR